MRLKLGQDFVTALLFIAIGAAALYIGSDYPLGTPQRPGTGALPRILSWCLIGTGGILAVRSFISGDTEISDISWRPLVWVTLSVIAFAYTIDRLGMVLAMVVSMTICAYGITETRWSEYFMFLGIVIVASWALFICFLGMPINTCPEAAPCDVCWVIKRPIMSIYELVQGAVR